MEHPINVLLFPEEQSFRLPYPSQLNSKLTFLADDDHQCPGPDTARLVSGSEMQASKYSDGFGNARSIIQVLVIPMTSGPPDRLELWRAGNFELSCH